eukprot:754168-Hanusia_phi.AAC.2
MAGCPKLEAAWAQEVAMLAASLLVLAGYHAVFHFLQQGKDARNVTIFSFSKEMNYQWIRKHMQADSYSLTAVQALRNQMLVGIFIGETSFGALAVIISAVSAIDLTCTLKGLQNLSKEDPVTGNYEPLVTPMSKVSRGGEQRTGEESRVGEGRGEEEMEAEGSAAEWSGEERRDGGRRWSKRMS